MLNLLRKKKVMKRILWVLAILIIPAFVLWGSGSLSKKREYPYKYIGTINDKKVTVEDFVKSSKDIQTSLFINYFNQPKVLEKIQNDRGLLNRLAWENLMIKRATEKSKVTVSNKEVVGFITRHPLFLRGEVFDETLYKYILRNTLGTTPRAFEENVRDFLVTLKYKSSIIENVKISPDEVLRAYKNEFEKAGIYYLLIDKASFKERVKAAPREIDALYEKNKETLRTPEKIIVQYIAFPHKEEDSKEKMLGFLKEVYDKLNARPGDMEKSAFSLNLTVKETIPFSQDELISGLEGSKDLSKVCFRLKPMVDMLPIIAEEEVGTSYIIRVKERIPSRVKSKEKVSAYLANMIKDEKALKLARKEAQSIYEYTKIHGVSLKDAAKIYNLELHKTGLISRFDYIAEIGESYKPIDIAFTLKREGISKPIEVRKGFAIIEPFELQFIDKGKFEKEKEEYRNKVFSAKKMKALADWFKKEKANSTLNVDLDKI